MEPKIVKVSDSGNFVVDFKRKRPYQVSRKRDVVDLPKNNLVKRRKLDACKTNEPLSKSVVRYYSNFLKSGQPQRVMYYQSGEWNDLPLPLLGLIKEQFISKNAIFEVEMNANAYLLDFAHMMKIELKSGLRQSIAWIDEAGNCFFPEIVSDDADAEDDEAVRCCHHEYGRDEEASYGNDSETNEIKLQLEIDINGLVFSKFNECTGESDNLVDQIAVNKVHAACPNSKFMNEVPAESNVKVCNLENEQVRQDLRYMELDNIRNLFLKGMRSIDGAEILDVYRGSSQILLDHEELFRKQVEITAKYRGYANVRYAWLACTKDVSSRIMKYGIGSVASYSSIYGTGIHLAAAECADLSVNLFDVDENGVHYVVLCQVVLGNMEAVDRGSDQFHPSCEDYDTGVDDLASPKYHIIWNMDVNSRIHPECVISFKASSNWKGSPVEQENEHNTSGVTASRGARGKIVLESTANKMIQLNMRGCHSSCKVIRGCLLVDHLRLPFLLPLENHMYS
uniref:PARP catalytic domain-containing protein n=1 Tax=Kalanchoe fedtschenkoi TaxID=63787 RepID=A0A7N0U4U4_KALFE